MKFACSLFRTYQLSDKRRLPEIPEAVQSRTFLGFPKYVVKTGPEGFVLHSMNSRVKIVGHIRAANGTSLVDVTFKPFINPYYLFVPIMLFFATILIVPEFTLNNHSASYPERIVYSIVGIGISYWSIIVLTRHKLDLERRSFEKKISTILL